MDANREKKVTEKGDESRKTKYKTTEGFGKDQARFSASGRAMEPLLGTKQGWGRPKGRDNIRVPERLFLAELWLPSHSAGKSSKLCSPPARLA